MKMYLGKIILKRLEKLAKNIGLLYRAKPYLDETCRKKCSMKKLHHEKCAIEEDMQKKIVAT